MRYINALSMTIFSATGKLKSSIANKKKDNSNQEFWQWNKVKCELYYIILYNKDGVRLPEHDTIAPPDKIEHEFPDIKGLAVRVLSLFKTNSKHGFVDICDTAKGLKNRHLIADLSKVKNENRPRGSERASRIHFGFMCSNYKKCDDVERVAFKMLTRKVPSEVNKLEDQIEVALQAGGEHNVKYLACTEVAVNERIFIAMELCIQTFDALIDLKPSNWKYINEERMRICFRHILRGLTHLHNKNIKHNKIKMENILLSLDGKFLKIGEYDYVERIEQGVGDNGVHEDVRMTATMFLKCFHRKSTYKAEKEIKQLAAVDETPSQISKKWIDLLTDLAHKITESKVTNMKDSVTAEGFHLLWNAFGVSHITTGQKDSLFSAYFTENLTNLGDTLKGTVNKLGSIVNHFIWNGNSYLEAYLIMHMILDKPRSNQILQHPYFWTEYKLLHFISRMEGYFYHPETVRQAGNIDLADGTKQKPRVGNVTDRIETIFLEASKLCWPELDWIQELENLPKGFCHESTRKKIKKDLSENKNKVGLCKFSDVKYFITEVAREDIKNDENTMEELNQITKDFWIKEIEKQPIDDATCSRSDIVNSEFVSENWKEMDAEKKTELKDQIWKETIVKKRQKKFEKTECKLCDIEPFLDFVKDKLPDYQTSACDLQNIWRAIIDENLKYNPRDVIRYMRLVRNIYAHYHEPFDYQEDGAASADIKKNAEHVFASAAEVWKYFGNVLPEMICLLHRAAWLERNNEHFPDDIRQFFWDNVDTLELGKPDEEIFLQTEHVLREAT